MNALRHHHLCTLEDYFEVELQSSTRFEFRDGAILAMSGGSWKHDDISLAIGSALRRRFRGTCRAFGPNLRIVTGNSIYTYADAGVVCGKQELSKYRGTDTLHNPTVVVEVLSPSTRDYDLGEKLDAYKLTSTIREVLLVEVETIDVRHPFRTDAGWETVQHTSIDGLIQLRSGGEPIPLSEIYSP